MTPYDKIFKILFGEFTSRHRSTLLCAKFVKIVRREIGEIVRYSCDQEKQNFGSLSNCRYCADRAQSLPWPATNMWHTKFQISRKFTLGGVIASSVKAVKMCLKVSPSTRLSYSFSPSKNVIFTVIILYVTCYYQTVCKLQQHKLFIGPAVQTVPLLLRPRAFFADISY